MRWTILLLVLLLQDDPLGRALKTIDEGTFRGHIRYLASDDLEGRAAGWPGNEKAVEYVVAEFQSYGLKPAGEGGRFTQEFVFGQDRRARNVLGTLEGSDPKLRGEYVVMGGHLDHVGRKGQPVSGQSGDAKEGDDIWNGADDNASGTSAILAVARAFAREGARPKRSLLFALWNAEEKGLVGSQHWTLNPTVPLAHVVYYLNLDMVGRNPDRPVDIEGVRNAEGSALEKIVAAACRAEGLNFTPYSHHNEAMFRSDGLSFLRQGIPSSMFFTYWHEDYHRVSDHADKIAYPNLVKIARTSLRLLRDVGNLDRALRLNVDTPLGGRSLRIRGEDMPGEGAFKVTAVEEGGALGRGGLRAGDVVVGFDGRPLPETRPLAEFWKRVQFARSKDSEVQVRRGEERLTLQVLWE